MREKKKKKTDGKSMQKQSRVEHLDNPFTSAMMQPEMPQALPFVDKS